MTRRDLLQRSAVCALAACRGPSPTESTDASSPTGDTGSPTEPTEFPTADTSPTEPEKTTKTGPTVFTPEMFGAKGDGVTDDYAALQAMATAVTDHAVVEFRKGATYLIDQRKEGSPHHVRPLPRGLNGVDDIIIHAADLVINLNGAVVRHTGFHRSVRKGDRFSRDITVVPLFLDRCERVVVNGPGGFMGPAATSSKDDGIGEGPCHGTCVYGGDDIEFNDVTFSGWLADGLWVGAYGEDTTNRVTAGAVRTNRCEFVGNARQGVSIVGCEDYRDTDSVMRDTGNTPYGFHSPASGCDVEPQPNQTAVTHARFDGTQFIDNTGAVFAASDRHGGQVGTVELVGISASFDATKAPRNRAVVQALTVSNDVVIIEGATLTNVYPRAGESCALTMRQSTVTVTDATIPCLTFAPNTTPSVTIEGCTFDYVPPERTVIVPLRALTGTFHDNDVFINGVSHDAAGDDIAAQFEGATLTKNRWSTDTPENLPWVVVADGSPDTDTYTGSISRQGSA